MKQQRALETRNHILEAARSRIGHKGYDATSVSEICRDAGVSKGAFYHHFASKQEVFMVLLNGWLDDMGRQLSALASTSGTIPDRLCSMVRVMEVVRRAAEGNIPIYLEFWTRAMRDPPLMQKMVKPFKRYRDFFAEMIEEGISEGSLKKSRPRQAARVIIALALGILVQGFFDPQGADWDEVSREGVGVLLEGLSKG